jgi:hypothetical protein
MSSPEELQVGDMTDEGVFVEETSEPNPSFDQVCSVPRPLLPTCKP